MFHETRLRIFRAGFDPEGVSCWDKPTPAPRLPTRFSGPHIPLKRITSQALQLVLADRRRWAILRVLAREGAMPAGALAAKIGMDTPWTSRNLGLIRDAGLVTAKYRRVFQITPELQPPPGAEFMDLGDFLLRLD